MAIDWDIKSRSTHCTATGHPFAEGETFHTLLFRENDGFRREDLCEEAFATRNDNLAPFSQWRAKFEPPPPPEPEALPKENAENLLRRYMEEDRPEHAKVRYILGLMLERKKILKPIDSKETGDGTLLIYEHARSGEIFLIPDPKLHLEQIEEVQNEVAALLGAKPPAPPATEPVSG